MENKEEKKKPQPGKAPGAPVSPPAADKTAGSILVWAGFLMLLAGYLTLWKGSTVAAPFLIVFGYLVLGLGILWS